MKPEREPYIQIIVGILAVAAIPPLAVILFDGSELLAILKDWQSGLGAFFGAFFGLGAILIGALFNANLNRKRDDRLREQEARALAAAMAAEMHSTINGIEVLTTQISANMRGAEIDLADFWQPQFAVYHGNIGRIGNLGESLDAETVDLIYAINALVHVLTAKFSQHGWSRKLACDAMRRLADARRNARILRARLDAKANGQNLEPIAEAYARRGRRAAEPAGR